MEEGEYLKMRMEEVRRKIDYQINENERLENHAHGIFRIILTAIGVAVTGLIGLISTGLIFRYGSPVDLGSFFEQFASEIPIVTVAFAALVSIIMFMSMAGFIIAGGVKLFIKVPRDAYRVLELSIFTPSLGVERARSESFQETEFLLSEYEDIIEKNNAVIQETRENWKSCHYNLGKGTGYFVVSLFLYLPFALGSPGWAIIVFSMEVVWGVIWLIGRIDEHHFEYLMRHNYLVEIGSLSVILFFIAENRMIFSYPLADILVVVSMVIAVAALPLYMFFYVELKVLKGTAARDTVLTISTFLIAFLSILLSPPYGEPGYAIFQTYYDALLIVLLSAAYITGVSLLALVLKFIYSKILDLTEFPSIPYFESGWQK